MKQVTKDSSLKYISSSYSLISEKQTTQSKKTGGRPKQTFLQRRHTDGPQTHAKMFNLAHYSVQLLNCSDSAIPWTAARQASLSINNCQSLLKLMSTESVMPSNNLILCCPLLLLPSIFPSIRVFSNESALCIRWPKYWSFSFNISPSNEHPGLISFRMDWLDLPAVQGALKSLLQQHSSKASILLCSAFLIVQLSHPYMTTGKTTALTRWTFADKVMPLLREMQIKPTILWGFTS